MKNDKKYSDICKFVISGHFSPTLFVTKKEKKKLISTQK